MDSRLRVLLVSWVLGDGGAERFTSTLLHGLSRDRFAPSLCLLADRADYPIPADVPIHRLGHRGALTYLRTIHRLRRLLEAERPNIVLSNLASTNAVTGEALRRCSVRPAWVARVGAPPHGEFTGWQHLLFDWWQRRVYPDARIVVANSRGLADSFANHFRDIADRVRVILNPTDFDAIDQMAAQAPAQRGTPATPLILSVGRLTQQKRPDLLLEAFARVRRRMPAELWLCGEGPLRQPITAEVARRGLTDSVRLLGFCANPYALLRQADLFVLASDFEGLPNALIEAQGLGVCAVSTRCPHGPDEIIDHGETGLLVPMADAGALAEAMEQVLADPARRAEMGRAARERTRERFDLRKLMRQWEDLLSLQPERETSCVG